MCRHLARGGRVELPAVDQTFEAIINLRKNINLSKEPSLGAAELVTLFYDGLGKCFFVFILRRNKRLLYRSVVSSMERLLFLCRDWNLSDSISYSK